MYRLRVEQGGALTVTARGGAERPERVRLEYVDDAFYASQKEPEVQRKMTVRNGEGQGLSLLIAWSKTEPWKREGRERAGEAPGSPSPPTNGYHAVGVDVPYLAYIPEKDRLLMLVSCDYPHHAEVLFSDDRGASWSSPKPALMGADGKPAAGLGTSLCYLGGGTVLFYGTARWFSRDHGQTWDLDHKYILRHWVGHIKEGPTSWYPSSQATSTVLLPDGSLLTAFGTGYRCQEIVKGQLAPRDVGMVKWRLNTGAVNTDTKLRDAPFDSDLDNLYEPDRH